MCATPEDPRQAFPFINVAIWKNADAYLAAFGGQAPEAGSKPRMIERDLPAPGSREVRLRVAACGVCHSDSVTVQGLMPGITYPRVPGHEVIGMVEAIGRRARLGRGPAGRCVGRFGGACGYCARCRGRRHTCPACSPRRRQRVSRTSGTTAAPMSPAWVP